MPLQRPQAYEQVDKDPFRQDRKTIWPCCTRPGQPSFLFQTTWDSHRPYKTLQNARLAECFTFWLV